jgi:ubiquitin-conjugating enzyme E2 Q
VSRVRFLTDISIETLDGKLLDDTPESQRRPAILRLIEKLPRVSAIKAALESGTDLREIDAPAGSIGVLRWVVGSCRAYLKEAKPGEGVLNSMADSRYTNTYGAYGSNVTASTVRQFTFVVGSPEQEANFKAEIETAQSTHENCRTYPTLLAFHGSAADRWHNILRAGLDYTEVANARVSRGLDPPDARRMATECTLPPPPRPR